MHTFSYSGDFTTQFQKYIKAVERVFNAKTIVISAMYGESHDSEGDSHTGLTISVAVSETKIAPNDTDKIRLLAEQPESWVDMPVEVDFPFGESSQHNSVSTNKKIFCEGVLNDLDIFEKDASDDSNFFNEFNADVDEADKRKILDEAKANIVNTIAELRPRLKEYINTIETRESEGLEAALQIEKFLQELQTLDSNYTKVTSNLSTPESISSAKAECERLSVVLNNRDFEDVSPKEAITVLQNLITEARTFVETKITEHEKKMRDFEQALQELGHIKALLKERMRKNEEPGAERTADYFDVGDALRHIEKWDRPRMDEEYVRRIIKHVKTELPHLFPETPPEREQVVGVSKDSGVAEPAAKPLSADAISVGLSDLAAKFGKKGKK